MRQRMVVATVAIGACVAVVAAVQGVAPAAAPATRKATVGGRFYDAIGPHALGFVLKTSGSGREVTITSHGYDIVCGPGPNKGSEPEVDAAARTVPVLKDGSFVASLAVKGNPPIRVAGRFMDGVRATGTLAWKARSRELSPCAVRESWTAGLRPLNDYFKGTTSGGAPVSFAVSVSARPTIGEFSVGGIQTLCPPGTSTSTSTSTVSTPATTTGTSSGVTPFESISDGYVGAVRGGGRFHAATEDSNGEAFVVNGTLAGKRASGVVSLDDRDGCGYTGERWTAAFVRRGL